MSVRVMGVSMESAQPQVPVKSYSVEPLLTLKAASDVYGRRMCILSSYEKNFLIEITPLEVKHPRVLWLSFWAEVHYNSLYPSGS